jgi:hypothetical protein
MARAEVLVQWGLAGAVAAHRAALSVNPPPAAAGALAAVAVAASAAAASAVASAAAAAVPSSWARPTFDAAGLGTSELVFLLLPFRHGLERPSLAHTHRPLGLVGQRPAEAAAATAGGDNQAPVETLSDRRAQVPSPACPL